MQALSCNREDPGGLVILEKAYSAFVCFEEFISQELTEFVEDEAIVDLRDREESLDSRMDRYRRGRRSHRADGSLVSNESRQAPSVIGVDNGSTVSSIASWEGGNAVVPYEKSAKKEQLAHPVTPTTTPTCESSQEGSTIERQPPKESKAPNPEDSMDLLNELSKIFFLDILPNPHSNSTQSRSQPVVEPN
eukprot:Nitzschia sp. Nitz4//scaffold147_size54853//4430//5002//NITZ4_006607-RA/size54853-processed-gene-0.7-mRNA-1//1//CDS//3329536663//5086//frame0